MRTSNFFTRSKVLIKVYLTLKTFDPLPKKNGRNLGLDRKLKITQNDINKTFDLVKTC